MTDDGRYISTSSLEPFRFFPSGPKNGVSALWQVSVDRTISWKNSNFPNGQAGFCLLGSNVWIYFRQPPAGCSPVTLGAIPKDDVVPPVSSASHSISRSQPSSSTVLPSTSPTPGAIFGTLATAEPVGCLTSSIGALALNSPNTTVSTLEQCVDVCAAFISSDIDYHYVGAQFGMYGLAALTESTNST